MRYHDYLLPLLLLCGTAAAQPGGMPTECLCLPLLDNFPATEANVGCVESTTSCSVSNNTTCSLAGTITLRFTAAAGTYTLDRAEYSPPVTSFTPVSQLNCVSASQTFTPTLTVTCDAGSGLIGCYIDILITIGGVQRSLFANRVWQCKSQ